MKFLLSVFAVIVIVGCETKSGISEDIDVLRSRRGNIRGEVTMYENMRDSRVEEVRALTDSVEELNIYIDGNTPKYIVTFELRQTHFTLDVWERAKDAMNAIEFEMPVDRDFYNEVSVGTRVVSEFRTGSFLLNGSFGDWEMTVKRKEIRK